MTTAMHAPGTAAAGPRPDQHGGVAVLRLGTRCSALALTQSRLVGEALEAAAAAAGRPVRVELVEVTTTGDTSSSPLSSFGGVGVFVSRLREALTCGEVDLAVHSLKDLPSAPFAGLALAAVPPREDPRDVLVSVGGVKVSDLPAGAKVGTGSPRRAAQLRALGTGLDVVDVRGNVDTRLRMVGDGLDAVVLANAGLRRLGRADEITQVIDVDVMLPAPGQGALAVECREGDTDLVTLLQALDDADTRACITAERSLMATLEAGCTAPLGALATCEDDVLALRAAVISVDGTHKLERTLTGSATAAADLGVELAALLLADGAAAVMSAAIAAVTPAAIAAVTPAAIAAVTPQGRDR
jgi:hydroxymethylbilane synthase